MKRFSSFVKPQHHSRTVEVRTCSRSSTSREKGDRASLLHPFPAVVVPLPRRPLFPGYYSSAFLQNQPALSRSLIDEKTVAAGFMLKYATDYKGSILRPGLQGEELLERLHTVGTQATIACEEGLMMSGVCFLGVRRVRMTGRVVTDDPLTVMVEPVEMEEEDDQINKIFQQGRSSTEAAKDNDAVRPFLEICQLFEELTGYSIWDPDSNTGSYLEVWNKDWGVLADMGPAMMPVLDKSLHQRALEETKIFRRLKLTTEIMKRELELDNGSRQWDRRYEDCCSEEEQEIFAKIRGRKGSQLDGEMTARGEWPIAPSVGMRVSIDAFLKNKPKRNFNYVYESLKTMRITEHSLGY